MKAKTTEVHFSLHGGPRALWESNAPEVLIEGPAGTGKTLAVTLKSFEMARAIPGMRILWLRQTRHSMTETVLQVFENGPGKIYANLWGGCSRAMRQSYEFPNGSSIVVGGLDNADKIMSSEYDMGCVFEATETSLTDYEKLTSRLRYGTIPLQQAICECNPSAPTHWLNQRANEGKMQRIHSRHQDNPKYFDLARNDWTPLGQTYVQGTLANLSGVRKLRLYDGRWVQAEGVVYEGWDPVVHIIDPFDIPKEWRRIRSTDFGLKNPFVTQWWAIDGDGRMYCYREIYKTGQLVEDMAVEIRYLNGPVRILAHVADHDAEGRATLERHGVSTTPAMKDIEVGIQAMAARLRLDADGRARMYFFRNAPVEVDRSLREAGLPTCSVEEFDCYVWPEGVDGKPVKEIPVDANNHGMDTARYAVMYANDLGKPGAGSRQLRRAE